ncbi:MAG TPA: hypothetical protein ENI64_04295 [Gammaproteobacteria bacterium]|nr:hypothetical protein [Gammaproteobacteria bacterium]
MPTLLLRPSLFYFLLLFTVFLYWPGLNGGFLLDDIPNLQPLHALDGGVTSWQDIILDNESGLLGRPVSMLTLVFNYVLNGNDPWSFKYTNLMIHLLCGVLIFWLSYRLLYETHLRDKRYQIALWVMAMWLLTPLQVSTVLYIVQRMAQLSTVFMLAGLISYTSGRQSLEHRPVSGSLLILSTFFVWLPLAVLSKENGALLPLLTLAIEVYFFKRPAMPWQRRFITWLFSVTVLLPALLLLAYLFARPWFITGSYTGRDFTLTERLYSEARILFIYLRSLLVPDSTSMGLLHDDFEKSTGLLSPVSTLLSVLAWSTIPVLAWIYRKRTWHIYFFAPIFFLAAHAMESSVFALELYFEHRNYLASFSVYLMLAYGLFDLKQRYNKYFLVSFFLILLPTAHVIASYQRIQVWRSAVSIILSDLHWHPKSPRAHGTMAGLYLNTGEYLKALEHINTVFNLKPKLIPEAYLMRLTALCGANTEIHDSEYSAFRKAMDTPGAYPPTESFGLLRDYIKNDQCEMLDLHRFIDIVEEWSVKHDKLASKRKLWITNVHLSQLMFDTGPNTYQIKALKTLDRAMKLKPEYLEAGLLKIRYALLLGKLDEAWETLRIVKTNNDYHRKDYTLTTQHYDSVFRELQRKGMWSPTNDLNNTSK